MKSNGVKTPKKEPTLTSEQIEIEDATNSIRKTLLKLQHWESNDPLIQINNLGATFKNDVWKNIPPCTYHQLKMIVDRIKDMKLYVSNIQKSLIMIQKANQATFFNIEKRFDSISSDTTDRVDSFIADVELEKAKQAETLERRFSTSENTLIT